MIVRQFDLAFTGPRVSVVICLVSTEDCDRIFETLESLSSKQRSYACEVVVADRRNDRISAAIAERFPDAHLVQCAPGTTLPELRTIALERSTGDIVAVSVPRDTFTRGFWETTVHPLLLQHGGRFFSRNAIKMYHCKKFSLSLFASQRYIYSRYFGGIRFARNQWLRRWAAAAASLFLPALLLRRMWVQATGAKRLNREFMAAMPTLLLFIVIYSVGEMVGYLFGPGDALAKIE